MDQYSASPRQNLKPREPILSFATPAHTGLMSPPNWCRESTRADDPATPYSPSDLTLSKIQFEADASPDLDNSQSGTKTRARVSSSSSAVGKSSPALKDSRLLEGKKPGSAAKKTLGSAAKTPTSSNSKSSLPAKKSQSLNEREKSLLSTNTEPDDDPQPSGEIKYIGENKRGGSPPILSQSKAENKVENKVENKENKGTSSVGTWSLMAVMAVMAVGLGALYTKDFSFKQSSAEDWIDIKMIFANEIQFMKTSFKAFSLKQRMQRSAEDWTDIKMAFSNDIQGLKTSFPSQDYKTFQAIKRALVVGMQKEPARPGVLVLLTPPEAESTVSCLVHRLLVAAGQHLPYTTPGDAKEVTVNASHVENCQQGRVSFRQSLEEKLRSHGLVGILGLEKLSGETAMALHGLADDSEAPYKHSVILMSLAGESSKNLCPEHKAEELLNVYWKDLSQDKVASLISRVTASVVEIRPETRETLGSVCPNIL